MINESLLSDIDWMVDEYIENNPKGDTQGCWFYVSKQLGKFDDLDQERAAFKAVKSAYLTKIGRADELEEAMKIVKAFGYKIIKEAEGDDTDGDEPEEVEDEPTEDPLEDESDEIKTMVRELADYTGNDYADAEVEYNEGPGSLAVQVTFGNEEYYCYESYDEAEEAAQEDCKELFDDIGFEGIRFENIGGIEKFVDESWFEDARRESAESYVYDIHDSEPDRYEEEFGDMDVDDAVEKYLDDDGYENDPVQWYIDNFGKRELGEIVKKNNLIDEDKLAEAIVDADGPANSLARYDGDEISLDCGYYCYRTN